MPTACISSLFPFAQKHTSPFGIEITLRRKKKKKREEKSNSSHFCTAIKNNSGKIKLRKMRAS